MSTTTSNLGLKLFAPTQEDSAVLEKDFKIAVAGTGNASNFAIIDAAFGDVLAKIGAIPVMNKVVLAESSSNTYTATVSGIASYSESILLLLVFPTAPTGATTIALNSLSPKQLMCIKDGVKAQIAEGDIDVGIGYIAHYDGSDFVVDSGDAKIYEILALKADKTDIGVLSDLATSNKGSIVLAINEVNSGKAAKTHASQHASDGDDPITPGSIGAAYSGDVATVEHNLGLHESDTDVHITADERTAWSGKAAGTHASQHEAGGTDQIHKVNLDGYTEKVANAELALDFDAAPVLNMSISGNTTFTSISGTVEDGYCKNGVLLLTVTSSSAPTVTFPSNISWTDDFTVKANSVHEIVFRKYPGITNWIASCSGVVSL